MAPGEAFGAARSAAVTLLVDNRADMLARSNETVRYCTDEPLLAEHGFAALVEIDDEARILWDAGITQTTLLENMRRLKVEPTRITHVALSHGHGDHTAAMTAVLQAMALQPEERRWEGDLPLEEVLAQRGRRVPLVAHPAAFRERWAIGRDGARHGPSLPPPRGAWEAAGAEIVLSEKPYRLAPGCWTTGAVPRRSFEKSGIPPRRYYRDGTALVPDEMEDDQALVVHVEGKGLVVVAGCAHAGIVNTVHYAREISGVEKVWAVLGGFHLARATAEELQFTIDEIKRLSPAVIAPAHCTGLAAVCRFAAEMPGSFQQALVGARFAF